VVDFAWDDDRCRPVKRKRADASEYENDLGNLKAKCVSTLKKLDKETRKLQSVVSNNNTKREIKKLTVIIRSLMSNLMTAEMLNMIRAHSGLGEKDKKKESRDEETQTPQCEEEWAETRRQAYNDGIRKEIDSAEKTGGFIQNLYERLERGGLQQS
jgi:hypothetical protein